MEARARPLSSERIRTSRAVSSSVPVQAQVLAQGVGHHVRRIGDGHHNAGKGERSQLSQQRPDHPGGVIQQVQPGLPGHPGLADGDHHDVRVGAVGIAACPHCHRAGREGQSVRHIQRLGRRLLRDGVHQHDLVGRPPQSQRQGAVAAYVSGPQNGNLCVFHLSAPFASSGSGV